MDEHIFEDAYKKSIEKISRNSKKIGVSFPHAVDQATGKYNRENPSFWTGGFWGGLVWLAYRETKDPSLFELACEIEEAQDIPLNEFIELHHDVGFMWLPTAVWHYRTTGCEKSRVRGLKAASLLAGRFNPKGRFIRSWNDGVRKNSQGLVIIDCMMNLPLLYWAWRELKDPRFYHIAVDHANTVYQYFIREDGTVPHIMEFDPETGSCLGAVSGQGKNVDSVWSRGQAWALYGFAVSYRETGDGKYLEAAEKIARKFMGDLPEDKIPFWDFQTDPKDEFAKDSTAACIAASGMLDIASANTGLKREEFTNAAKAVLEAVIHKQTCFDDSTEGIVQMGTVNYVCRRHINVPIIYGDFYLVEALGKLKGLPGMF